MQEDDIALAVSVIMDTRLTQIFEVSREVLELLEIDDFPTEALGVMLIEAVRASPIADAAAMDVESCLRKLVERKDRPQEKHLL